MVKLLTVIILLIAVLTAMKTRDTHTILAEIDRDKFGGTMLSMIALNLASKAGNDEITILLNDIIL